MTRSLVNLIFQSLCLELFLGKKILSIDFDGDAFLFYVINQ